MSSLWRGEDGESLLVTSRRGLTGKARMFLPWLGGDEESSSWAVRRHPDFNVYAQDQHRQRASYIATRRQLAEFLVPHRFEGDTAGPDLRRALFGFAIGLNSTWVMELMGHVRQAESTYQWGPLGTEDDEAGVSEGPSGGPAELMWEDATLSNQSWVEFFEHKVLEWLLTSVGGLVVVDVQSVPGLVSTGPRRRPVFRWFPAASVEDYGTDGGQLRWVKLSESVDNRTPRMDEETGFDERHLLYELDDADATVVGRYDDDGDLLGEEQNLGTFVDREGQPTLPMVKAAFGEHPDIGFWGSGLLMGPDDIVIDLYNQVSEMREAFRDNAFSFHKYWGENDEEVTDQFKKGSRLVRLGDSKDTSDLVRDQGQSAEVTHALEMIDVAIKAWALSAKRKAAEAMETATAASGVQIKAEFQLDDRPLLTVIAGAIDEVEANAMYLAAQAQDQNLSPAQLTEVGMSRDTTFNLEPETGRITRIVSDFKTAFGASVLPNIVATRLVKRWLEATGIVDLNELVETGGVDEEGEVVARPLGEVVSEQIEAELETATNIRRAASQPGAGFPPLDE